MAESNILKSNKVTADNFNPATGDLNYYLFEVKVTI